MPPQPEWIHLFGTSLEGFSVEKSVWVTNNKHLWGFIPGTPLRAYVRMIRNARHRCPPMIGQFHAHARTSTTRAYYEPCLAVYRIWRSDLLNNGEYFEISFSQLDFWREGGTCSWISRSVPLCCEVYSLFRVAAHLSQPRDRRWSSVKLHAMHIKQVSLRHAL